MMGRSGTDGERPLTAETGQALVIGAVFLLALTLMFLFFFRLQQLYNMANFLEETSKFAAEMAARPDGEALVTGNVVIIEPNVNGGNNATNDAIQAAIQRSLEQINQLSVPSAPLLDKSRYADADEPVYVTVDNSGSSPRVEVTLTMTFNFYGFDVELTRKGIAESRSLLDPSATPPPVNTVEVPVLTPIVITPTPTP